LIYARTTRVPLKDGTMNFIRSVRKNDFYMQFIRTMRADKILSEYSDAFLLNLRCTTKDSEK
jgi:hypothetical protein